MDVARTVPMELDLEAELLAAYPMLTRRLTVVLHDGDEAQDISKSRIGAPDHPDRPWTPSYCAWWNSPLSCRAA